MFRSYYLLMRGFGAKFYELEAFLAPTSRLTFLHSLQVLGRSGVTPF